MTNKLTVDRHLPGETAPKGVLPSLIGRKLYAWLTIAVFLVLFGGVSVLTGGAGNPSGSPKSVPVASQSELVAGELESFEGGNALPAIVVYSRKETPLQHTDLEAARKSLEQMVAVDLGGRQHVSPASPVIPLSGNALQVTVNLPETLDGLDLTDAVVSLRAAAKADMPEGLVVEVTGPAGFAADISAAFKGSNVTLLIATALVVAVLLILTYRSPVLWLVPLIVTALADRMAAMIVGSLSQATGFFDNDGSTAGITSVLVFGAGTNYALLLVSRYREELSVHKDHRKALKIAWKASMPAIVSSNLTVVVALLSLIAASVPAFRSLGISSAIGLLVAVVFALVFLPAALSVCGRRLFWPSVPKFVELRPEASGVFHGIAHHVAKKPAVYLSAMIVVLLALGSGLFGTRIGLSATEQFRTASESAAGQATLAANAPAGSSSPLTIIGDTAKIDAVAQTVRQEGKAIVLGQPMPNNIGDRSKITVLVDAEPASAESYRLLEKLRTDIHDVDGTAMVGGLLAQDFDAREGVIRDMKVCLPIIFAVVFLVLLVVLKGAVLAPILLLAAAALSAFAAMGVGTLLSTYVLHFPALDVSAPLYAVLFLVALGIDYTVFLVLRTEEESRSRGTRAGMVRAVGLTGGVITSAGLVLAAVFAVLGVLPLITLTQVGIIVGVGILLDTFLVRTIVVPALFELVGDRIWWPKKR